MLYSSCSCIYINIYKKVSKCSVLEQAPPSLPPGLSARSSALNVQAVLSIARYYEKSIIEQEIEEQRKGNNSPAWVETKRNIREARYRLSLRTGSLDASLATTLAASLPSNLGIGNGSTPRNGNSTTTSMSLLPKEEISMTLMSP